MLKKIHTLYELQLGTKFPSVYLTMSTEAKNHMSVHSLGEPCNGVLHHWGTRQSLIEELRMIADRLEKLDVNSL